MATCYRCKDMKKGKRRFCRHTRPAPCRCGGLCFPHRRGSRAAGWGACEAHPDHYELMTSELKRERRRTA